jgi:Na+-transporting NADH:ubiquinone oxidoreductase subunit C
MNQRIRTVLFTVVVTVVFVAPISFVYLLTKPMVRLNEEVFLKTGVLSAAGIALPSSNAEIVSLFASRVEEVKTAAGEPAFYRVKTEGGGDIAGYVLISSGPGLWGQITATIGFDRDRETLTGIAFLSQSETPGLGARIDEPWFKTQFRGKRGPFTTVGEGEPAAENQFDALTGASITSTAVQSILNAAIARVTRLGN